LGATGVAEENGVYKKRERAKSVAAEIGVCKRESEICACSG
jgi:hypothetical protein